MLENEIIEKYKKQILEKYKIVDISFEEWLKNMHNKSIAFDNMCNPHIIINKNEEINKPKNKHNVKKDENDNLCNKPIDYAYIESIRGAKRNNLNAEECNCCQKYYDSNQKNMQNSSRHRYKYKKSKTPPEFYDIDF